MSIISRNGGSLLKRYRMTLKIHTRIVYILNEFSKVLHTGKRTICAHNTHILTKISCQNVCLKYPNFRSCTAHEYQQSGGPPKWIRNHLHLGRLHQWVINTICYHSHQLPSPSTWFYTMSFHSILLEGLFNLIEFKLFLTLKRMA